MLDGYPGSWPEICIHRIIDSVTLSTRHAGQNSWAGTKHRLSHRVLPRRQDPELRESLVKFSGDRAAQPGTFLPEVQVCRTTRRCNGLVDHATFRLNMD